ncbi:MAG TPA: methyltransferase, FxLD system [Candidatus Binatia bacterium]|nr:methyltransferase, FxLD system [Candidatus Binatia bacterium]
MADAAALHRALVDGLVGRRCISDARVEAAFRAVPRHLFLPGVPLADAYRDQAIPTKTVDGEAVSSSSQPEIMATMLEQLKLEPGLRVLEIGAGTGYNAALMAHIVGEEGAVVTVDIDQDLVDGARDHLATAGFDRVRVVLGDGGLGHRDGAPYDRIILTVGAWDVAPAWREQLGPNGRLVLPLMVGGSQKSVAFVHSSESPLGRRGPSPAAACGAHHAGNHLVSASVKECLFMRLRGAFAAPPFRASLDDGAGLHLYVRDPARVDPAAVRALLAGAPVDLPTGVRVTGREVYGGLVLWIAVRESGFCWLEAIGPESDAHPVPRLFALSGKYRSAAGVFEEGSAVFFMRPPGDPVPAEPEREPRPFELHVRGFGDGADTERLRRHARAWDGAGRPGTDGLRIRALPIDVDYTPTVHEQVIVKRWTRLVLDWPDHAGPDTSGSRYESR